MATTDIVFEDLGLSEPTLKAIHECGYTSPTPIQAKAIPSILMMRDVVGLAQTGTGKTASFTLPMIDILSGGRARAKMPRSLILTPTRELAAQIADNFEKYGKYHPLSMALLVGGVSMGDQIKKLEKGVDVLIATPGRLLDLFGRGNILLTGIKVLVIDEADRMMDMGFIPDLEKIASLLPAGRQTLLFSATMPNEIRKLTHKFLTNPKEVSVAPPASPAERVEQFLIRTTPRNKKETLLRLIEGETITNAFIFCNRKRDVSMVADWLKKKGVSVGELHGDMVQKVRTETLEQFKNDEIKLLVGSDVVARGIDIQGVSHVFNYDVPMNADDYVHRIGRTGRAGLSGRALMLATDNDDKLLEKLEAHIGKSVPVMELPGTEKKRAAKSEKAGASSKKSPSMNDSSKNASASRKNNKSRHTEDDSSPQGFGDEVPDFFNIKTA
jgi:superfamily II DNA/RNA helicase